jgi:formylmethanofuran dehydrogenase subunit B
VIHNRHIPPESGGTPVSETLAGSNSPLATHEITCVFCGLHCDDLTVGQKQGTVAPIRLECAKAHSAFAVTASEAAPRVGGQETTREKAIARAAALLTASRRPLFGGLGTDVNGMRAVLRLAERCDGLLSHMHGAASLRNLHVLQQRGWHTTTLGEIHNRADLVVIVGAEVERAFPRFISRHVAVRHALQRERLSTRRLAYLGPASQAPSSSNGLPVDVIPMPLEALAENLRALQGLLAGTHTAGPTGKRGSALKALASQIAAAAYPVFVWAPSQLPAATGDLVIAAVCDVVSMINRTRRAAGLALGGDDGAQTALATSGWLTGFGAGVGFQGGALQPRGETAGDADTLLRRGDADLLLYISSFSGRTPPRGQWPVIALAPPGFEPPFPVDVYLPVGIPGIDHAGQIIRTDGAVALPLRSVRPARHPSVADTVNSIAHAMGEHA